MFMDSELWATIRRMREVDKQSISAISRQLHIHRDTVRRALASIASPPANEARGRLAEDKLGPFTRYIGDRLKEYPDLTGSKLLLEIRKQGYRGGYTILKEYVRDLRPASAPGAFLRLETQPGEYSQVDWANIGSVQIGNARRQLSCFVMVLSYSRMMYLEFTLSQRLEDFIAAHVNAFRYFGGVPQIINYDNLKTVVLSRVGADIRFHTRFMDFAGYYLIKPVPCGIRKANEKGKVESGIKYVRSAFLAGRVISSHAQAQAEAEVWLKDECNVRIHGSTHERPIDRFEADRIRLTPLPANDYDCAIAASARATSQALVHFDSNRYSVPFAYAGRILTIKAWPRRVTVYSGTRLVSAHVRCYEKYRVIEDPRHYDGLLAQRKKARLSKQVELFLALGPDCRAYLKGLAASELSLQSQLDKIMNMAAQYGNSDVNAAIARALRHGAYGAHFIQNIILQQRAARNMAEPQQVVLTKKPQWTQLAVEETDMALYDQLFEETAEENIDE
jgi:transposase